MEIPFHAPYHESVMAEKKSTTTNNLPSSSKQKIHMKSKLNTLMSSTALALSAVVLAFAPSSMAAPKDTLNADDVEFVKQEAAAGAAELKLAELAVKKAGSADVKAFAKMMVTDHSKANEELAKLAATKGVELSAIIDPTDAATFQKLEAHSGTDFDKEFISHMVSSHKKCVGNFETASKEAKDTDVKAFAAKMLPTLRAHHEKAEALSGK